MIIDSHCHLDYDPLVNNIDQVLLNAKNNNISKLLTIGTSLESSKKVLEIVEKYENIYGAIGVHPNSTTNNLDDLNQLINIKKKCELDTSDFESMLHAPSSRREIAAPIAWPALEPQETLSPTWH